LFLVRKPLDGAKAPAAAPLAEGGVEFMMLLLYYSIQIVYNEKMIDLLKME
jgi:hypothetical protein